MKNNKPLQMGFILAVVLIGFYTVSATNPVQTFIEVTAASVVALLVVWLMNRGNPTRN